MLQRDVEMNGDAKTGDVGTTPSDDAFPEKISYWRMMSDQGVITREIRDHKYAGSGTESDPFAVSWLEEDPRNPMRFGMARKVLITLVTGFATLAVSLSSSGYSGSVNSVIAHFDVSDEVATLGLSLFIFGFSVGPLLWAPLSESIGRQKPFFVSFLCMSAFLAGCAGARNIQTLLVLRFFAGVFGSSPLSNAGGVVSDMFPASQRGLALCLFAATPYIGRPPLLIDCCPRTLTDQITRSCTWALYWRVSIHERRVAMGRRSPVYNCWASLDCCDHADTRNLCASSP